MDVSLDGSTEGSAGRIEIPEGRSGPRFRSEEERARIAAESLVPGVRVADAEEPLNRERIDWKLITNLPVCSSHDVVEMLFWYALRWEIKVFHRILKSGCRTEKARLRTAERLVAPGQADRHLLHPELADLLDRAVDLWVIVSQGRS